MYRSAFAAYNEDLKNGQVPVGLDEQKAKYFQPILVQTGTPITNVDEFSDFAAGEFNKYGKFYMQWQDEGLEGGRKIRYRILITGTEIPLPANFDRSGLQSNNIHLITNVTEGPAVSGENGLAYLTASGEGGMLLFEDGMHQFTGDIWELLHHYDGISDSELQDTIRAEQAPADYIQRIQVILLREELKQFLLLTNKNDFIRAAYPVVLREVATHKGGHDEYYKEMYTSGNKAEDKVISEARADFNAVLNGPIGFPDYLASIGHKDENGLPSPASKAAEGITRLFVEAMMEHEGRTATNIMQGHQNSHHAS